MVKECFSEEAAFVLGPSEGLRRAFQVGGDCRSDRCEAGL